MIEFGYTLRTAREAKGMSIKQVAEATHMMVQVVEGLENEDFARIVAPIYGRGFVKLYCETVGLDPKPLVAAFMELYSGNRSPAVAPRQAEPSPVVPPAGVPPPEPPPAPSPAIEQPLKPPTAETIDEPMAEPPSTSEPSPFITEEPLPEPQPEPPPPPIAHTPSLFDDNEPEVQPRPPTTRPTFAPPRPASPVPTLTRPLANSTPPAATSAASQPTNRYAAPIPIDDDGFSIPTFLNWRLIVLAIATAAIIAVAVIGVKFIYRATMTDPADKPAATEPAKPVATKPDVPKNTEAPKKPVADKLAKPATPAKQDAPSAAKPVDRKPLPLKPFYIDSNHETGKEKK